MFGEDTLRSLAESALTCARSDEAEALLLGSEHGLTRFAGNHVHQNVVERNLELRVRVARGNRVAVAASNELSPEGIQSVVARAEALADLQPPLSDWPGLPGQEDIPPGPLPDPATAAATPEVRADFVSVLCRAAAAGGAEASGALSTGTREVAVANSHGVSAYAAGSRGHWVSVVMAGSGAGYSEWTGWRLGDAVPEALAEEALGKALASRDPVPLAPGDYAVVLEPYAVATLVEFLGHLGFSGQAVVEGRSFLAERRGETVASPAVTIVDDWRHPAQVPLPFDFEGVRRQPVACLVAGVAQAAVWDRRSAARAGGGQVSTGHALPAPSSWGPAPLNLVMAAGTATTDELVAGIERGVYVTRFNYVRTVQPRQTMITGLTRDGTFLIQDGRLAQPVCNLRFTETILAALSGVDRLGRQQKAVGGDLATTVAPALALRSFHFTGATSF
jgi:PmbA protein